MAAANNAVQALTANVMLPPGQLEGAGGEFPVVLGSGMMGAIRIFDDQAEAKAYAAKLSEALRPFREEIMADARKAAAET